MISENDVRNIGNLAKIHFRDEEIVPLAKDLEAILGYINQLEKLDVSNVEPMTHALSLKNVFRQDEIKPSLNRDELLKTSVKHHKGAFQVPKIIG